MRGVVVGTKTELELKLRLSRDQVTRLKRHRAVQSRKASPPKSVKQRTVFFDTPNHSLRKVGITLRLRRIGNHFIQNAKLPKSGASLVMARTEFEAQVVGAELNLDMVKDWGLSRYIDGPLSPVFEMVVTRSSYILVEGQSVVRLDVDVGDVIIDQSSTPICEAELELLEGPDVTPIYRIAREAQLDVPMALNVGVKADLGYALISGAGPAPVRGAPVVLLPTDTVGDSFHKIGRACVGQILANVPCLISNEDREGLHQMRVALRRFRSALKVYRPFLGGKELKRLRRELKWLANYLGPARDMDVFLVETLQPVVTTHPRHVGLANLHDHYSSERAQTYTAAVEAVTSQRFTRLMLDLGAWLEAGSWKSKHKLRQAGAAQAFAYQVLESDYLAVLDTGEGVHHLAPEDLHALRIELKALRYAASFFKTLFPDSKAKKTISALAKLQDCLGHLNDLTVAQTILSDFLEGLHGPKSRAAAQFVLKAHLSRAGDETAQVEKRWKRFRQRPVFWRKPSG